MLTSQRRLPSCRDGPCCPLPGITTWCMGLQHHSGFSQPSRRHGCQAKPERCCDPRGQVTIPRVGSQARPEGQEPLLGGWASPPSQAGIRVVVLVQSGQYPLNAVRKEEEKKKDAGL